MYLYKGRETRGALTSLKWENQSLFLIWLLLKALGAGLKGYNGEKVWEADAGSEDSQGWWY